MTLILLATHTAAFLAGAAACYFAMRAVLRKYM